MAGEFRRPIAEWNIKCDPESAHIVFSSGIPIDVIPWEIGMQVTFGQDHLNRLNASPKPLARRLAMAIDAWQRAHAVAGEKTKPMPHLFDPMTIATFLRPDLCTWKRGTIRVELQGQETYGYTVFYEDVNGLHNVAWDSQRDEALGFWFDRIERV